VVSGPGLVSDGVVAVPRGPGRFRVLLLKVDGCDPRALAELAARLPSDSIIDEIDVEGM
jgi:hypothetical protein